MKNKYDPFVGMVHGIKHRPKEVKEMYLVDWYIGVAKRYGWEKVLRLLAENKETEERMKMLIKKRLGK